MKTLLSAATTTETSQVFGPPMSTFQATGSVSSSTGSAVVLIEVSNDGVVWLVLGTITLELSTTASGDGFSVMSGWQNLRARIASISGTGAAVTVTAN